MIVSSGIWSLKVMETEMKVEQSFTGNDGVGKRILVESSFLFHKSLHGEFFSLHDAQLIITI